MMKHWYLVKTKSKQENIAIFKAFKPDDRVILLMNLLGREQKLTIKQESLNAL